MCIAEIAEADVSVLHHHAAITVGVGFSWGTYLWDGASWSFSLSLFLLLQDLFVLLDLIGAPSPRFGNQFPTTKHWLSRLQSIGE